MPNECPALRPPAWAEKYRWHWLRNAVSQRIEMFVWHEIDSMWIADMEAWEPTDLTQFGWRYIGPADPSARVIDPENEAVVECVKTFLAAKSHGIFESKTGHKPVETDDAEEWDQRARTVLAFLKERL